ncbi:site-specific DNA-methyltransferase [Campylobacter upsaliensis]|uniref:site-specific DNA-methyltransferase n=1 Tax=Campylobacter upsaliensis TaxID=28080 RepID=UPI003A599342
MPTKQRLTKQHIKRAHIIDSTKEHNPLLDYLAKHHPQTISEERLNLDALSQALGFSPSSMQGYGLSFIGKPLANALYSTPTTKELKELDPKHSQNIIIKGDNLHALKLLKSAYDGKIKMIYIDPPYNTKNEKFIYDDNFVKEYQKLLIELDLLKLDSNGKVLEKSEVLHFLTNPSGDKAHSGWLSFMLPRLKLARDLLKDDGVIFISIDDNEQANLKILCDEIFGEENFVANVIWEKSYSPINLRKHFSTSHDYILCYAKSIENLVCNGLLRDNAANDRYINPDNDIRGKWKPATLSVGPAIQENIYEIVTPSGRKIMPPSNYSWMFSKKRFEEMLADNRIWFGKNGDNVPSLKRFLSEVKQSITPLTIWKYTEVGHQQDAMRSLKDMFDGNVIFNYPKSIDLIKRYISLYSTNTGGGGGRYSA